MVGSVVQQGFLTACARLAREESLLARNFEPKFKPYEKFSFPSTVFELPIKKKKSASSK